MLACLTLLVRNRRSAAHEYLGRQHSAHTATAAILFPTHHNPILLLPCSSPLEGDGGAGAPVLLEHRVSPGARLLTLVGHHGVTSERSELCITHYSHLPYSQRQEMPVRDPHK